MLSATRANDMNNSVYVFLADNGDRRTKLYKKLETKLDLLVSKFGKESEEVKCFLNSKIEEHY